MYEENKIISVCVVRGEKNSMTRIADVRGNELISLNLNRSNDFGKGVNRDRLYYNDRHGEYNKGDVGVWKWNVIPNPTDPDKERIDSVYQEKLIPIEVIDDPSNNKKEDLATRLRSGINLPVCNHHRMFLFQGSVMKGVLCAPSQMEMAADGVLRVKSDVFVLPCYDVTEEDLLDTERTSEIEERCLYRFLQPPQTDSYFYVRSPEETVKELLIKRVNKRFVADNGGTRKDFAAFSRFIKAIPENDMIRDISARYRCPESQAAEYWKDFQTRVDQYIRCEDIETEVLRGLLEDDDALRTRLEEEWRNGWLQELEEEEKECLQLRTEYAEQRKTLEADFAEFQKDQQAERTRIQREIKEAEACLGNAQEQVKHYEALSWEGLRLVREKLSLAREEAAEFLADLALFGSPGEAMAPVSSVMPERPVPMARFLPGAEPEEWEDVESAEDRLEALQENLKQAGADKKRCFELAAFLYGAFLSGTPLLLAGPQGAPVADALSCAMTGRHAAVLNCCGEWNPAVMEDIMGRADEVVIVKHPFQNRWIDHLLPELDGTGKGKRWIFIHPYADDLPLEPSSLYQYALPLVLDIFMRPPDPDSSADDMICCRKGKDYRDFPKNEDTGRTIAIFKKLSRNFYLETKVRQLVARICGVPETEKRNEVFLCWSCLFFPLAVALGQKEVFLETIKDSKLEQADRTFLENAIGEIR